MKDNQTRKRSHWPNKIQTGKRKELKYNWTRVRRGCRHKNGGRVNVLRETLPFNTSQYVGMLAMKMEVPLFVMTVTLDVVVFGNTSTTPLVFPYNDGHGG